MKGNEICNDDVVFVLGKGGWFTIAIYEDTIMTLEGCKGSTYEREFAEVGMWDKGEVRVDFCVKVRWGHG